MLTIYFDSGVVAREVCLAEDVDWLLSVYETHAEDNNDRFNSFVFTTQWLML